MAIDIALPRRAAAGTTAGAAGLAATPSFTGACTAGATGAVPGACRAAWNGAGALPVTGAATADGPGAGGAAGSSASRAAAVVPVVTTAARIAREGFGAATAVLGVRTASPGKRRRPAVTPHPPSRVDDGLRGRPAHYEPISALFHDAEHALRERSHVCFVKRLASALPGQMFPCTRKD